MPASSPALPAGECSPHPKAEPSSCRSSAHCGVAFSSTEQPAIPCCSSQRGRGACLHSSWHSLMPSGDLMTPNVRFTWQVHVSYCLVRQYDAHPFLSTPSWQFHVFLSINHTLSARQRCPLDDPSMQTGRDSHVVQEQHDYDSCMPSQTSLVRCPWHVYSDFVSALLKPHCRLKTFCRRWTAWACEPYGTCAPTTQHHGTGTTFYRKQWLSVGACCSTAIRIPTAGCSMQAALRMGVLQNELLALCKQPRCKYGTVCGRA